MAAPVSGAAFFVGWMEDISEPMSSLCQQNKYPMPRAMGALYQPFSLKNSLKKENFRP